MIDTSNKLVAVIYSFIVNLLTADFIMNLILAVFIENFKKEQEITEK